MFKKKGAAKKSTPRERAMVRLVQSMDEKHTEGDKQSKELQHFWGIMLRGMQVRILQKKGKSMELSDDFWVFWMTPGTAPVLYLRREKSKSPATGMAAKFVKGRSMALHQLTEVRYGGLKVGAGAEMVGEEEEDDDEETAAPCLNKMVAIHSKDGQVIEFEVTVRAAELLLQKFTIVIQALDMFEKVERQIEHQVDMA